MDFVTEHTKNWTPSRWNGFSLTVIRDEIHFQIFWSIGNPKIQILWSKSKFSNRTQKRNWTSIFFCSSYKLTKIILDQISLPIGTRAQRVPAGRPAVIHPFFSIARNQVLIGSLSMQRFWTMEGNRNCAVFPFNLSLHYHICILKSLFTCRDD